MTLREDIANLRKLVETFAPRPERAAGLRLLDFYVKAVVTLREGYEDSPELEAAIIAHVRERIAHFKAPRSVDVVRELPRTPTGKLVKRRLEALYTQEVPS